MIKKIVFSLVAILISSSSLFAYTENDIILYPEIGLGGAGGEIKAQTEGRIKPLSDRGNEVKNSVYWNIGFSGDYFFDDWLSLTFGLFIDKNTFKVTCKSDPSVIVGDDTKHLPIKGKKEKTQ